MTDQISNADRIWVDDVLGRRSDANYLHSYLTDRFQAKKSEPGFVLAINAEWGFGKTFMLNRWKEQALLEQHPTIYFDAWKSDFAEDPLLAFIADLENNLTEHFKKMPMIPQVRKKTLAVLKKVWKPSLTILAATAAKHVAGLSLPQLQSLIDPQKPSPEISFATEQGRLKAEFGDAQKQLQEIVKKSLDGHRTTQAAIQSFKEKLGDLVTHLSATEEVKLPLLIFIDELDRCRPDYAIELLEGIKHIFGVPGVYFVVATNVGQLAESIKAVYGAGFDGHRYLRRFFDLNYSLSEPANDRFARLLSKEIATPPSTLLITQLERYGDVILTTGNSQPTGEDIVSFVLAKHADAFELALRDQQQVSVILEAAFLGLANEKIHVFFLVFLAVIYQINPGLFRTIERTGNLQSDTEFQKIFQTSERGLISVRYYDHDGKIRRKSVSTIEIANIYFSNLRVTDPYSRRRAEDFPENLLDVADWARDGATYIADYNKYFNIVQGAGRLISKR